MVKKDKGTTDSASKTKITTNNASNGNYYSKRERAQTASFAKLEEIIQRNVNKEVSRSFTQYTKTLIKDYMLNPLANQHTLREISRFLCRASMLYQQMLVYYASMPLFHYNITQVNDLNKEINPDVSLKKFNNVLKKFNRFNIKKDGFNALYFLVRDGIYVGYMYDTDSDGMFLMPLDPQYVRIIGKNSVGEWVCYFNAAYFDRSNNIDFVNGIDGNVISSAWDQVFIDGYRKYKRDGRAYQYFRLPPEKTCVITAGADDEFFFPLPYFLPLFTSLLDLLDLEQIIQSKNVLENYKLVVSRLPLVDKGNSGDIDDFAISLELADFFNSLLENTVPDQVGVVYSPMDIETVTFENSNSTKDTDRLGDAIQNLFDNAGASKVVIAGGGANPSAVAIKYSQIGDRNVVWTWVNRFESWLNYYIRENISSGYIFEIFRITEFNREEFMGQLKELVTLGGSMMDFVSAHDGSPYRALQKLRFENAIGLKDWMVPLKSTYTIGGTDTDVDDEGGRPKADDDELTDSGERHRNNED